MGRGISGSEDVRIASVTRIVSGWRGVVTAALCLLAATGVAGCDGDWLPGETCPYRSGSSSDMTQNVWTEEQCAVYCNFDYTFTPQSENVECGTCVCGGG
jgi:hypothetical protein